MEGLGVKVLDVEETKKPETHMTSAAAFVEGGIQESCDDACSICLEEFTESNPSMVTSCKHEFHLQCILEWCQRSFQCPMCLQPISFKDPTSQELFEAVEQERNFRTAPSRNSTIFHHPSLGDFELQHLSAGASDSELEERIIQHLAAAAAMRRAHPFSRREGQRNRSSLHGRSQLLAFSAHPGTPPPSHVSSALTQVIGENEPQTATIANPSTPHRSGVNEQSEHTIQFPSILTDQSSSSSGTTVMPSHHQGTSVNNRNNASCSSPPSQNRAGPSEFQSFSESLKSRISAVSMRFNESISRSTRGWKERLFSRNGSMSDLGSEVRREVNAGIASVSQMMEHLETGDNDRDNQVSVSTHLTDCSVCERDQDNADTCRDSHLNESSATASCAATSASA